MDFLHCFDKTFFGGEFSMRTHKYSTRKCFKLKRGRGGGEGRGGGGGEGVRREGGGGSGIEALFQIG